MVKYEDSSLLDKLSFLFNTSGFVLILFSYITLLDGSEEDGMAVFIISFLFYLMGALTIICQVTMGEVDDGKAIRIIHIVNAFIATWFLVVGLGLFGQQEFHYGFRPSPYGLLLGVCALVLIIGSCALGVASLIVTSRSSGTPRSTTTITTTTSASGPTTFSG